MSYEDLLHEKEMKIISLLELVRKKIQDGDSSRFEEYKRSKNDELNGLKQELESILIIFNNMIDNIAQ